MAAVCLSRRSAWPAALAGSWVVSMAARSGPNTRSVKNQARAVAMISFADGDGAVIGVGGVVAGQAGIVRHG